MTYGVVLVLGWVVQVETVAGVVEKMDAALGEFRDVACAIESSNRGGWFPLEVKGGAKLKIRRSGEAVLRATVEEGEIIGGLVQFEAVMGREEAYFSVRGSLDGLTEGKAAPLHLRARGAMTPESMADADFLLLPTAYPVRLFLDEPLIYYALAPKRYFGLVPDLKLEESDGKLILSSRVLLKEPIRALGVPLVQAAQFYRRFIIDPKTYRLERMVVRIDLAGGMYGVISVSEVRERNEQGWPTRIDVRSWTLVPRGNWWAIAPCVRTITYEQVNTAFELPTADPKWAYAELMLKPASVYADRIKKDEKDVTAHASLAASRIWVKRVVGALLDSKQKASPDEKALQTLEAVQRLRPEDPYALLNLVFVEPDAMKRTRLIATLPGDPELGVLRAYDALSGGKPADALEELGKWQKFSPLSEVAAQSVRIQAMIRLGRAQEALTLVDGEESLAHLGVDDKTALEEALLKSPDPPEQAVIAFTRTVGEDRERAVKLMTLLEKKAKLSDEAGELAIRLEVKALSGAFHGTPYGFLLEGKPLEALALLEKLPRDGSRLVLAGHTAAMLGEKEDHEATLKACALYLEEEAHMPWHTDLYELWRERSVSPYRALARVFAARKRPEEIVRLTNWTEHTVYLSFLHCEIQHAGLEEVWCSEGVKFAAEYPNEGEVICAIADLVRSKCEGNELEILSAAVNAGSTDSQVLLALAQRCEPLRACALYAAAFREKGVEISVETLTAALQAAQASGQPERAQEFRELATRVVGGTLLTVSLAIEVARAEGYENARRLGRSVENIGLRPFVLYGWIAELEKDYEQAVRWYNRAKEEGSDLAYVPNVEEEFKKRTGASARAELMRRIGEDYFVEKLLKEPLEKLTAEEEEEVRRLYTGLMSEAVEERDLAAESLRRFGRRAVQIVRMGLDSGDIDLRDRVKSILREWAEPR